MENKKKKSDKNLIRYFGYGANASPEMLEAIIGRKPDGLSAMLSNYELWIQSWQEMPIDVRNRLAKNWDENFRTYAIRPAKGKIVFGKAWFLAPEERRLVSNWEFWYQPMTVQIQLENGEVVEAETEMIDNQTTTNVIDTDDYSLFINDKGKMLQIAKSTRNYPSR